MFAFRNGWQRAHGASSLYDDLDTMKDGQLKDIGYERHTLRVLARRMASAQ